MKKERVKKGNDAIIVAEGAAGAAGEAGEADKRPCSDASSAMAPRTRKSRFATNGGWLCSQSAQMRGARIMSAVRRALCKTVRACVFAINYG